MSEVTRILSAIGSTLDVLLFQLAVRADENHGAERAGAQLADNMAVVLAVRPAGLFPAKGRA